MVHYRTSITPTVAEIEADFTRLWTLHADPDLSGIERRLVDVEATLAELGDIITGGK